MPYLQTHTFHSAAEATGNGTPLRVDGMVTVVFDVAISATATVTFEAAGQSGTFVSLPAENVASGAIAATATATGAYRADVTAFEQVRARISSYGSGTVTVLGLGSDASGSGVTLGGLGASEAHIGEVSSAGTVLDVTLSLDTLAYASGDVLADTQEVTTAFREAGGIATLSSLVVIDEDDQKVAFTVYFLSANVSMGTENAAPSISDADARNIIGWVDVTAADYKDLGGVAVADVPVNPKVLKAAAAATSLYVAAVNGTGTPTYTASGLKLKIGLLF